MNRVPRRITLVEQVTRILRQDVLDGRWTRGMPGEHRLSDELQVSRSTLRVALDVLRREGLVQVAQGKRRSIASRPTRRSARSTTIGLISPLSMHESSSIFVFDELRRRLQAAGYGLQIHVIPQVSERSRLQNLQQLYDQTRAACWVLSSCSLAIQRWFAQQDGQVLVLGSCHKGVDLPFIRSDLAAACRHAVGALHRHGHHRVGLLLPRLHFAGAVEAEESMRSACEKLPGATIQPHIRYCRADSSAVTSAVSAMMKPGDSPTALMVLMPVDAITVHSHLLNQGLRLGKDVSLVSILDHPFLSRLTPTLTRYTYNNYGFARYLARQVIKLATSGGRPASISIVPDFIPGETIGPPTAR